MDYKNKYLKYKQKYLELKQRGGSIKTLEFDLTFMKSFIKRLINEFNLEFDFNFIINETDNKLYVEIIKGVSDMSKKTIFNSGTYFGYLKGHTHFNSFMLKNNWKYAPPSSADYNYVFKHYFRYYLKKNLVFTPQGIFTIELNEDYKWDKKIPKVGYKFFDEVLVKEIKQQLKNFNHTRCDLDTFDSTPYFEFILDRNNNYTNNLHKCISGDPKLDKTEYPPISIEEYLEKINKDGFFIVTFQKWQDIKDLKIRIDIPEFQYKYVNHFVKNKNILYQGKKVIITPINSSNLDEIFKKLKEAPEGTEIIFN